jgi:hypothetical protein
MGWTFTVTEEQDVKMKHELGGDRMLLVKVAAIGDGSAGTLTMKHRDLDPSNSYVEIMDKIRGSWLYLVKIIPSATAAPDNTYDLDFEDETNSHILDTDANPISGDTWVVGSNTLGVYPVIFEHLALVFADIGSAADATDVYMYFLK